MLKTSTLVLFLAVASVFANAQEKWFMQKITPKVSVNFPLEPKKISDINYGIKDNNDVVFLVSSVDLLKATGFSLEEFNNGVVTQSFADEFMSGLTPTLPKYTFKAAKIITIKGQTAYQVVGRDETNKSNISMNIVFVDGTAHSLTTIIADGKDTKNRDKFLNEIYINGK